MQICSRRCLRPRRTTGRATKNSSARPPLQPTPKTALQLLQSSPQVPSSTCLWKTSPRCCLSRRTSTCHIFMPTPVNGLAEAMLAAGFESRDATCGDGRTGCCHGCGCISATGAMEADELYQRMDAGRGGLRLYGALVRRIRNYDTAAVSKVTSTSRAQQYHTQFCKRQRNPQASGSPSHS
ncbi:hypothetical protein BC834DRAFT_413560 [Gloeopeniophorella convolvens]|nr:hypothetical protein BC834DRAFT_413560 [Gloeopeniophorella convolvens]